LTQRKVRQMEIDTDEINMDEPFEIQITEKGLALGAALQGFESHEEMRQWTEAQPPETWDAYRLALLDEYQKRLDWTEEKPASDAEVALMAGVAIGLRAGIAIGRRESQEPGGP
jgi:hypothetical protein